MPPPFLKQTQLHKAKRSLKKLFSLSVLHHNCCNLLSHVGIFHDDFQILIMFDVYRLKHMTVILIIIN